MSDHITAEIGSPIIGQSPPVVDEAAGAFWNAWRVATLKKLWAEGISGALIANQIGATRNAVAGKVNRLDLPERVVTKTAIGPRISRPRAAYHAIDVDVPASLNLLFDQVGPMQCHYPYGDEAPFLFCGHDVMGKGAPYCTAHMQICYGGHRP